ncbi:N-lysine methyltransferase KMT5A-A [Dissostichus eleginoides]|uniref:N-lysine methyltransferase KMT5A-A n=1 Tax=Dissostichus eleginoides TaxID=100907 RepID=A0AAD9CE45_DISEL|nr:N-lysine methyltransferase KMT5A-A [Dissostichus eleginoides]
MQRRRRRCINPKDDARCYIDTGGDKAGLDVQYINAIKGRGIFTSIPFQTGDFLIEYRGELISQQECETRLKRYPARLKGFMFEFHFDGKLWCVDAAKEHESLGRLVNDNHRNPTAKMKKLSVQGKPHLCLFADRDISPGEEITYNYGDSDWPWRCKGLDEVMPLETCGATQAQSQNENIEEMVTNSDCTETTESFTKTTGQVFSPLSRAEKHCLRIASVSSLDRCVSCVGPVSSKWLGYECRECSQVWHKSCFRNIQDDNLHYLPKPSENSFRDELQSNQSESEKDQISDEGMSGLYIRKDLWRHVRRCPCKPKNEEEEEKPGRTKVLGLASAQESVFCQQISSGVWKLLNAMRQDEVAAVVRNDLSIIQFAQSLYSKHGQDPTKYEYIRQKLREVGRLLLCLRTEFSVYNLEEAVKPANCQRVVQARDDELIKSTKMFEKLYTSKLSEFVSHSALNTLSGAKYNKPSTLPFTEDVQILHRHLDKSAESAICNLKEEATPQNYAELAKVALAQIIVFNRRSTGEVSKMHLKHFNERDNAELHQDVAKGLSKTEQRLCNYFSRVEITGKRGRKVAVLLSPSMFDALSLLVSKRTECGVCSTNVFLFARPKCMSYYRGQDCLRLHASKCGAKHPEHLRSTHLRKHVATLSQVLNLKNNELDQVADFLGHDIRVHQDFYRLPVPTTQLAKISKLLLSMEKGQLSSIQGKSLDEIDIEDEISFSDAVNSDSDDDETAAPPPECGTSQPVTSASTSVITEQAIDHLAETVSSTVSETAPPYEGKDHEKARKTIKKPWAKDEVAAVMRHFKLYIAKGNLATKSECHHCKLVEGKVLDERTVQNVRDFVRNRGIARKRQSQ